LVQSVVGKDLRDRWESLIETRRAEIGESALIRSCTESGDDYSFINRPLVYRLSSTKVSSCCPTTTRTHPRRSRRAIRHLIPCHPIIRSPRGSIFSDIHSILGVADHAYHTRSRSCCCCRHCWLRGGRSLDAVSLLSQMSILILPLLFRHMARSPHTLFVPPDICHRAGIPVLPRGQRRASSDGNDAREEQPGKDGRQVEGGRGEQEVVGCKDQGVWRLRRQSGEESWVQSYDLWEVQLAFLLPLRRVGKCGGGGGSSTLSQIHPIHLFTCSCPRPPPRSSPRPSPRPSSLSPLLV
jgi:hypothetical protein